MTGDRVVTCERARCVYLCTTRTALPRDATRRFLSATKENLPPGASHAVAVPALISHLDNTRATRAWPGQPATHSTHRKRVPHHVGGPGKNIAASSDSLKSQPAVFISVKLHSPHPSWFLPAAELSGLRELFYVSVHPRL